MRIAQQASSATPAARLSHARRPVISAPIHSATPTQTQTGPSGSSGQDWIIWTDDPSAAARGT